MKIVRAVVVAVFATTFIFDIRPAYAVVQVHDNATFAESVKSGVVQGKILAESIKGWATTANIYWTAVENTVKLPAQAISKVTATYNRINSLVARADRLLASDAPMMQRINMLNSLAGSAGRLPGSTIRSAEWWAEQAQDQWEDDKELLALEGERQELMDEALEFAASQGNIATGQMQMLQANHTTSLIAAKELQRLNQQMQTQWAYALEQQAKEEIKQSEYRRIMTLQREFGADQSW